MASGSSKAHSKTRRPGNSNSVTALAVAMPIVATPTPTSRHSSNDVQV